MKTTNLNLKEILKTKESLAIKARKHLVNTDAFTPEEIDTIMLTAKELKQSKKEFPLDLLKSSHVALAFFENSTRTKCSFSIAATNLGANVLDLNISTSSSAKGETLVDTAATLIEMGVNAYVQRHSESGSCSALVDSLGHNCSFINAGEGKEAHPTQALLDYFTMLEYSPDLKNKKVTIIGDTRFSRVARSNVSLLTKMGASVHIASPPTLLAEDLAEKGAILHTNLKEAVANSDFIMVLRIQYERLKESEILSKEEYISNFQLNHSILDLAGGEVKVMHPGPVNRDLEITSALADDKKFSLIRRQVHNGVFVRMAVLALLLNQ